MLLKSLIMVTLLVVNVNAKNYKAKKIADKTIHFSDGTIKKGGHRNWRNNNPGNLEYGPFTRENGAIGTDGRFAIFPSMQSGYRAHVALLSGKVYRHKTLRQALRRFAPSFENNTKKYLSYLSKNTGISKNKKLKHLSFSKKLELVRFMAKYEGMKRGSHYKSGKNFAMTRDISGQKVKSSNRTRYTYTETYTRGNTEIDFKRMLNPKKTRLHKILMSN